jgi:hypothetical protein
MKFLFKLIFFFLFSHTALAEKYLGTYTVKTKGINIGVLSWDLELTDLSYDNKIILKSNYLLSKIYKFKGNYSSKGTIKDRLLIPVEYKQEWVTKKKDKVVNLIFEKNKISKLVLNPIEKEYPRINYLDLINYVDPITSFLNIILYNKGSLTIDGRRSYFMFYSKENNKINIKNYKNIWADHQKKDFEYLEFSSSSAGILPETIMIKFKKNMFYLIKN